jgi:hypothetical protein
LPILGLNKPFAYLLTLSAGGRTRDERRFAVVIAAAGQAAASGTAVKATQELVKEKGYACVPE